jgi:hypothetical protein
MRITPSDIPANDQLRVCIERRPCPNISISPITSPFENPANIVGPKVAVTPDEKAFVAARALASYLRSVGIMAEAGEGPSAMIPVGQVHIAVGHRESNVDPKLLSDLEQPYRKCQSSRIFYD